MRRLIMLVTVVLLVAAMLMFAGPASAQAGCQDFGQYVIAAGAPHGEAASEAAPLNDEVSYLKQLKC